MSLSESKNRPGVERCAGGPRTGESKLRARSSRFDLQLLEGVARTFRPAKEKRSFTVDVSEDLPLKVEAMHVEMYGPARFVIHGVVAAAESIPAGTVLLSVVDGVLPRRSQDDGRAKVRNRPSRPPDEAFSSTAAMEAYCQLAVASANTMFANSAVAARARLVHTARVNYAESGEVALDLARLTILPASWDVVASLREQYGADVVHLFGSSGTSLAGMATGSQANATPF